MDSESLKLAIKPFCSVVLLVMYLVATDGIANEQSANVKQSAPNIVFILTDNQGYHELGCHGHETVKTPRIDAFSEECVDFTNFHAPPFCSPSRGLLLTGEYALRSGVHDTIGGVSILHKDKKTLANYLGDAGYRTGIFGKWHLGTSYPYAPRYRGFQEAFVHGGGGIGQLEDLYGNRHLNASYWHNGEVVKSEGFSTDILFGEAMKFIETNRERSFFAFISTPATHKPWQPHPDVAERIKRRASGGGEVKDLSLLSMIENIDDNVGKVLDQLDRLKLRDNTIVVVATDQGMRSRGAPANDPENPKSNVIDERHHVFFMLRYPPLTQSPGRNDALTGMVDVAPTLLDLCGIDVPDEFDGRSLRPLWFFATFSG